METFSALLAFVRGIHRFPVNSLHKGQWRGALMFSLICVWINGWENNSESGDLRRYRAHYDVIVMFTIAVAMGGLGTTMIFRNDFPIGTKRFNDSVMHEKGVTMMIILHDQL